MNVDFHRTFKKELERLPHKVQEHFFKRLEIFEKNQGNVLLRVHALRGTLDGYSNMNVTGDYRAPYVYKESDMVIFVRIDTHSELYGK